METCKIRNQNIAVHSARGVRRFHRSEFTEDGRMVKHYLVGTVRITVNMDELLQDLAYSALKSKRGRATARRGAIVARAMNTTITTEEG